MLQARSPVLTNRTAGFFILFQESALRYCMTVTRGYAPGDADKN